MLSLAERYLIPQHGDFSLMATELDCFGFFHILLVGFLFLWHSRVSIKRFLAVFPHYRTVWWQAADLWRVFPCLWASCLAPFILCLLCFTTLWLMNAPNVFHSSIIQRVYCFCFNFYQYNSLTTLNLCYFLLGLLKHWEKICISLLLTDMRIGTSKVT